MDCCWCWWGVGGRAAGPPLTGAGVGGVEVGGAAGHPLTGTGVGGVEVGGAAGSPLTGDGVEVGGAAGPPLTGAGVGGVEVGGAAGPPLTGTGVGGVEVGGVDALDRCPPVGPSLGPVGSAMWPVRGLQGEGCRALILCMLGNRRVSCISTCVFALSKPFKRD